MAVDMRDVAREASVSISTISKYLNGGSVKEDNRRRIRDAIDKLGYAPNEFARGVRDARTHTVGVLVHQVRDSCSGDMISTIERGLREAGYSLVLGFYDGSRASARECIEFLAAKQVDGLLVEPIVGIEEDLDRFRREHKPVVALDSPLGGGNYDSVTSNSMIGVYQGVEYLIGKGHRRIGIIGGGLHETKNVRTSVDRMNGFLRAMGDYDLPVREDWIIKGDFRFASGYEGMKQLWRCGDRPTALIVANYYMFMGAMKAIHELHIRIPEELSLVTMDNMALTWIADPPVTCISQPMKEMAQEIVQLMLRRLQGDYHDFPCNIKRYTALIERQSVAENSSARR